RHQGHHVPHPRGLHPHHRQAVQAHGQLCRPRPLHPVHVLRHARLWPPRGHRLPRRQRGRHVRDGRVAAQALQVRRGPPVHQGLPRPRPAHHLQRPDRRAQRRHRARGGRRRGAPRPPPASRGGQARDPQEVPEAPGPPL
ncbi:hypothetical protein BN1723_018509, partial [Verticillium longisporum]